MEVQPGNEILGLCQSWTLHNDEPLHVNGVHMKTGPGWHHSNWFFVPETFFDGADGTWDCEERDFDEVVAGVAGGVLFAQSTQAVEELQRFVPGAALIIPPRSRIVVNLHLLNASDVTLRSAAHMTLELLAPEEVHTRLMPLSLTYFTLDIPPRATSRFTGSCDLAGAYGGPLDFRVHYVLPHYHTLGRGLSLDALGGDADGAPIFRTDGAVGEPLGGVIDPPFDMSRATGMRFGCTFRNPGDENVGWGNAGGEMCMLLAFTDSDLRWLGAVQSPSTQTGVDGEVIDYAGSCTVLPLR